MAANDSKSYLGYLNKLVDQYNNTCHRFSLTEDIESSYKASSFKVGNRVSITKYKYFFSKGYTENWSRKLFIIDAVLKTSPWTYKIKVINGEKISFYEKELLPSKL